MTDAQIIIGVVAAYLITNLIVGLRSGRGATDTVAGYVAGDREFGTVVMYFITGASMFSAFAFLGGPGWTYGRGGAAFYILGYGVLGMAPFFALGPWAARLGRKFGYVTMAGMLAHRFDNRRVAVVAGVISVIAMIPYTALQMQGAGIVLEQVTQGAIPVAAGAALAYGVVLIYVWRSGVLGIGWTNVFQGVFMIVMAWALGLYIPYKLYGGVGAMFTQLEAVRPEMLTAPGLTGAGTPWTAGAYTSAVVVSAIGVMMWPHLFMKAFAAKSDATLRRTIVLFPTFQLFLLPLFLVGFAGILYQPSPETADAIMPHIVLTSGLPALVVGLFCAGALAASMSTGDALVHGAASIAVEDVYGGVSLSQHTKRAAIRIVALGVGILGYSVAIYSHKVGYSLVALLLGAYGFVVQLAPAVYSSFLWKRTTAAGTIAGLATGAVTTVFMIALPRMTELGGILAVIDANIHPGLIGLAANILATVVVSLSTSPPNAEHVNTWFQVSRTPEHKATNPT